MARVGEKEKTRVVVRFVGRRSFSFEEWGGGEGGK